MNDRPLNSYYYRPHCSNYVVHWVSLCIPHKKTEKKGTPLFATSFLSSPFFQTCCLIYNLWCVCDSWKGGTLPYPREVTAGFSFLSPVHTHTPLRLWSLSPGAQEFSDLGEARLGIKTGSCSPPPARPGLGEREKTGPLLSPRPPCV